MGVKSMSKRAQIDLNDYDRVGYTPSQKHAKNAILAQKQNHAIRLRK